MCTNFATGAPPCSRWAPTGEVAAATELTDVSGDPGLVEISPGEMQTLTSGNMVENTG